MVLYYTHKQKTKIFAQAISELRDIPTHELKSDLSKKSGFAFIFNALKLTLTKKTSPVTNIPENVPHEIYVCSPVWGGRPAAPVKYFLENSALRQTKVHLILTASAPTDKYRKNAVEYLQNLPCIVGDVFVCQNNGEMPPDKEVLKEQLQDLLEIW